MKILKSLFGKKRLSTKVAKTALKELMFEQLAQQAQAIAKKNEELEAKIAILTPNPKEDKKMMSYIG